MYASMCVLGTWDHCDCVVFKRKFVCTKPVIFITGKIIFFQNKSWKSTTFCCLFCLHIFNMGTDGFLWKQKNAFIYIHNSKKLSNKFKQRFVVRKWLYEWCLHIWMCVCVYLSDTAEDCLLVEPLNETKTHPIIIDRLVSLLGGQSHFCMCLSVWV